MSGTVTPYRYYVSFAHTRGFGGVAIRRPVPVRNHDDVMGIARYIEDEYGQHDVIVLGWQRFEDDDGRTVR